MRTSVDFWRSGNSSISVRACQGDRNKFYVFWHKNITGHAFVRVKTGFRGALVRLPQKSNCLTAINFRRQRGVNAGVSSGELSQGKKKGLAARQRRLLLSDPFHVSFSSLNELFGF